MKPTQKIRSIMERAMALHQKGDAVRAEPMYREVLELDPDEPNAWHLLGVAAWQRNDLLVAEEYIRKAIRLFDKVPAFHNNLGGILKQRGAFDEAILCYETSLKLNGKDATAQKELAQLMHQRGLDLAKQQRWDEAQQAYRRVLDLDPDNVATLNNLASVVQHLNNRPAAYEFYNRAIKAMPENYTLRYNRAICYLTDRKLEEGWADLDVSAQHWRSVLDPRTALPWTDVPFWDGGDIRGKRILIWGDHGIGDEILYASMVPDLLERGAIVTMESMDRLVPLLQRSFPGVTVLPRQNPPLPGTDFDCQAPYLWLARRLRPNNAGFPDRRAFLKPDPDKIALLRERYRAFGKKYIVGISWFSLSSVWGIRRSIPLPDILSALPLEDMLVIDTQYGDTADAWRQARQVFPKLTIFHDPEIDQMKDMDGYAAQIGACDSIVTICNTTSHLAGALGVPTAVLMSDIGLTWYWFAEGEDCPWYPSLKLLRPAMPERMKKLAKIVANSGC